MKTDRRRMRPASFLQPGFTLIEIVTALVVISVGTAGVLLALNQTVSRSADPLLTQQANAIAQSYLEEITSQSYCDPDLDDDSNPATPFDCVAFCTASICNNGACYNPVPAAPPTAGRENLRSSFDDVCDYDGLVEAPTNGLGQAIAGLSAYSVSVEVDAVGEAIDGVTSNSGQSVLVNVTVTPPAGRTPISLSAYRLNF